MEVTLVLAIVLPWAMVAFQGWIIYLLIRQHGASLLRQDELRDRVARAEGALQQLSTEVDSVRREAANHPCECKERKERQGQEQVIQQMPAALAIGTPAPEFSLPDLAGRQLRLSDFRGKPLLLFFFNPRCGFCVQMAPRLGQLPTDGPSVLAVSQGDPEQLRHMAAEHRWRCQVALERGQEVSSAYRSTGTPTGYLIDAQGRIASNLAIGADALLALLAPAPGGNGNGTHDLTADSLRAKEQAAAERARAAGLAVRESKLDRDGLPAGTKAPDFTLPDLSGAPRSMAEFRGRRVLLVFSDTNCGPCQAFGPALAELHQRHAANNLQVVMVSRGGAEANAARAREHGFRFPVLLQNHWEISKEYAIFATPVAYLIDERGVIASKVAIGADAILQLV